MGGLAGVVGRTARPRSKRTKQPTVHLPFIAMKPTSFLSIFALSLSVMADSCNKGGVYCGVSLLRKGKPPSSLPPYPSISLPVLLKMT
jgi:hypothetical protein